MEDGDLFEPRGNHEFELKVKWTDLGWTWQDLYQFCNDDKGQKIVWTEEDRSCCIVTKRNAPDQHEYHLDVILQSRTPAPRAGPAEQEGISSSSSPKQMTIAAVDCEAAASTVAGLMDLVSTSDDSADESSSSNNQRTTTLIFKSFARQPRQPFPPLFPEEEGGRGGPSSNISNKIHDLQLHFCGVDANTRRVVAASCQRLELRQCQVDGLTEVLSSSSSGNGCCPPKLAISCTMPEFQKFAAGFGSNTDHCGLKELELLLHFLLQGEGFAAFCAALATNHGLETLTLSYLDISDESWALLFSSLAKHPSLKRVELKFTDNFVDNYRRMTPERRTARTQAVLDMLQENLTLQEIKWPEFQQDESLMADVNNRLANNTAAAQK